MQRVNFYDRVVDLLVETPRQVQFWQIGRRFRLSWSFRFPLHRGWKIRWKWVIDNLVGVLAVMKACSHHPEIDFRSSQRGPLQFKLPSCWGRARMRRLPVVCGRAPQISTARMSTSVSASIVYPEVVSCKCNSSCEFWLPEVNMAKKRSLCRLWTGWCRRLLSPPSFTRRWSSFWGRSWNGRTVQTYFLMLLSCRRRSWHSGRSTPAPLRLTFFWGGGVPSHPLPLIFVSAGPPVRLTFFWGGRGGGVQNTTLPKPE